VSFAIRNSLILGVLLLLVVLGGLFWSFYYNPTQVSKMEKRIKKLDLDLQNTPDIINQFNESSARLLDMEKKWTNRKKDIPTDDITSQTYAYLSHLLDLSGYVKTDLIFTGVQKRTNYGFNTYNLKGEGPFENLYRFIWYIENGRRLYKISSLTLKGNPVKVKEDEPPQLLVVFAMDMEAYFTTLPDLASSGGLSDTTAVPLTVNPFLPAVYADIPTNSRGLVEVERSDLKAVIPGKAFILDQTNTMKALSEGDEVYLGYVSKIIPDEGRVEFTLNKGGIGEKVELRVRLEAPSTK